MSLREVEHGFLHGAGADAHQRYTHHAAEFQIRNRHGWPDALLLQRIEIHGEQLAARAKSTMDHGGGHLQVGIAEGGAEAVAGHAHTQIAFVAQQEEPALGDGDGHGRIHHRRQHVVDGQRVLQRAGHFHQRAQLPETAGSSHRGQGGRGDLLQKPLQLVFFQAENQFVGIREAEFDAIRRGQALLLNALAVHVHAVAAIHVLNGPAAVVKGDASVGAGRAVVAEHQVIVALPSDEKRQRLDGDAGAGAGGIDHHEPGGSLSLVRSPRTGHQCLRALLPVSGRFSPAACVTSCVRNT